MHLICGYWLIFLYQRCLMYEVYIYIYSYISISWIAKYWYGYGVLIGQSDDVGNCCLFALVS